ncbi:MAG: HAMP domain-containing histidine kinase [Cyanobacteria bacterium SZAS-4]|nr:HAMP domain-containing histidine kinase [Cyanobacteria bacterium SZAS-4]
MSDINAERELKIVHSELKQRTEERDVARGQLLDSDRKIEQLQQLLKSSDLQAFKSSNNISLQAVQLETGALELADQDANLALIGVELAQSTENLHNSNLYLANRTAELEAANAELRQLMQQKEDFVAALTHDLKSPLIACMRAVELLVLGKLAEDQKMPVYKQLLESIKSMLRMIWNLLDVYRNDAGHLNPVIELVSVKDLLMHCVSEFSFGIDEKQLQLNLDSMEAVDNEIATDRILLRRVLINLFDNAIKFSPQKGELTVCTFRRDKKLFIAVSDSGPGMPEAQQKRIFERFWQTKLGRDRGIGTGLGLHLSRQIMNVLGGTIECHSKENHGTRFTVSLPCE